MSSAEYDVCIVGQGIAGALLAWSLAKQNKRLLIFDVKNKNVSSRIAAGLVNPVTGRRFAKSWNFEQFNQVALPFYQNLAIELSIELVQQVKLYRPVPEMHRLDQLTIRAAEPEFSDYLTVHKKPSGDFEVIVRGTYRIRLQQMFAKLNEVLSVENTFKDELFENTQLINSGDVFQYKNYKFKQIVFCEGFRAQTNPFFTSLPFELSKGEILKIESDLIPEDIFKEKIFNIPYGDGTAWIGPTNTWDFENELPTEKGREDLMKLYQSKYNLAPKVIDHLGGIRPTTKTRRPFIDRHPKLSNMYIFNGLGTKGTLLAPFMIQKLMESMRNDAPIDPEFRITH